MRPPFLSLLGTLSCLLAVGLAEIGLGGSTLPFVRGLVHSQQTYTRLRTARTCSEELGIVAASQQYRGLLEGLGRQIRRDFPTARVKRVLYPLSAYDASTPATVFPGADVIAVDRHPFEPESFAQQHQGTLDLASGISSQYETQTSVDRAQYLAPRLLGSLVDSGFRITSVTVFTLQGDFLDGERAVHGLIHFDSGPGTRTRRYFQIQSEIPRYRESCWWLRSLSANWKPDALLVKGSMSHFSRSESTSLRQLFLGWLADRRGLLVTGGVFEPHIHPQHGATWMGELIPSSNEVQMGQMRPYRLTEGFSYGDAALVFEITGR